MTTTCAACQKEIPDGFYCNNEAGIPLCQKCSAMVAKHFIDGYYALAEINYVTLERAKQWISLLIETEFGDKR